MLNVCRLVFALPPLMSQHVPRRGPLRADRFQFAPRSACSGDFRRSSHTVATGLNIPWEPCLSAHFAFAHPLPAGRQRACGPRLCPANKADAGGGREPAGCHGAAGRNGPGRATVLVLEPQHSVGSVFVIWRAFACVFVCVCALPFGVLVFRWLLAVIHRSPYRLSFRCHYIWPLQSVEMPPDYPVKESHGENRMLIQADGFGR
jgi:hypothetical protein